MAAATDTYSTPEPFEVPEGGLASFLTATVGDWAEADNDDYVPETGIAQIRNVADKLAEYGRYEDEYIVHAAEGETVIPAAVLDANPRLKASLFSQMRDMGIEPERYIVGNELNSINPVTGQPEFFLKKIFKGIKKVVKGVVKVFKKVAPIVLSVAGMAMGLGPIGAAFGSGIGTLIQGGNLKDALKAGLISGITAGIGQGLSEGFQAAQAGTATGLGNVGEFASGFGQSVTEGLTGGYVSQFSQGLSNLGASASNILNKFTGGGDAAAGSELVGESLDVGNLSPSELYDQSIMTPAQQQFAGADNALASGVDRALSSQAAAVDVLQPGGVQQALGLPAPGAAPGVATQPSFVQQVAEQSGATATQAGMDALQPIEVTAQRIPMPGADQAPSYLERLKSDPIGTLTGSSAQPTNEMLAARQTQLMNQFGLGAKDALTMAQEQLAPSLLQKYGTAAAVATGLGAATGMFDTPPPPEPVDFYGGVTGADLLAQNPGMYSVGLPTYGQGPAGGTPPGQFSSSLSQYGPDVTAQQAMGSGPRLVGYDAMGNPVYEEEQVISDQFVNPMYQSPVMAARGGEIEYFPRRNGPIYGPGTETSDDVPAMLSDGEFVMTARAVRGAGNGDRERGMMRMYEIMRKFEGGRV